MIHCLLSDLRKNLIGLQVKDYGEIISVDMRRSAYLKNEVPYIRYDSGYGRYISDQLSFSYEETVCLIKEALVNRKRNGRPII